MCTAYVNYTCTGYILARPRRLAALAKVKNIPSGTAARASHVRPLGDVGGWLVYVYGYVIRSGEAASVERYRRVPAARSGR